MSEGSGLGVCDEIPHGTRIPIEDLRFLGSIPVGNYLAKRKDQGPLHMHHCVRGSEGFFCGHFDLGDDFLGPCQQEKRVSPLPGNCKGQGDFCA